MSALRVVGGPGYVPASLGDNVGGMAHVAAAVRVLKDETR